MTTEKAGRNEQKEQGPATCCCLPQRFMEMMAQCGEEIKGGCVAMMQEMMKGECCPPEEK